MVEDLTRWTNGKQHPMDEADLAVARHEIAPGDARLVREGVLTLEKARERKSRKPRGGWPVDLALHRAQISIDGYKKVLREEWTMEQAKEAGRDHVEDVPAKIENAAAKSKHGDVFAPGTKDPANSGLKIGDEVWIRTKAEVIGGPNKALMLRPQAVNGEKIDKKHYMYAYKLDFVDAVSKPEPETVTEYIEYVPEKAKIKTALTEQYRELWQRDREACANGAEDGSDVSGLHVAMSELMKLSKKLRLGVDFRALDKAAQQTKE